MAASNTRCHKPAAHAISISSLLNLRPRVRKVLRSGLSDDDVAAVIASLWRSRDDRYSELRSGEASSGKVETSYVGG